MNPRQVDLEGYLAQPTTVERELRWLLFGRRAPVIFDIGACEGEDSIRYARRFPGARVYSFEPLPANQAIVRANFAKYGVENAELIPLALSDRTGPATFHVSEGQPQEKFCGEDWNYGNKSSSLLAPAGEGPMHGWINFSTEIQVECDTLDAFCAGRGIHAIDFIHMDVQGAEYLVLSGGAQMLGSTTAVWMEVAEREVYRGQRVRSEVQRLMEARGFTLAFEQRGAVEGDQFYVNPLGSSGMSYLLSRRVRQTMQRLRRTVGNIGRKIWA